MNRICPLLAVLLAGALPAVGQPRNVLFAGNSYLWGGGPETVTAHYLMLRIAELDGHPFPEHADHIAGGATTSDHRYGRPGLEPMWWDDSGVDRGIIWESPVVQGGESWDVFILQGQSTESNEVTGDVATFRDNAAVIGSWVRRHSPSCKILLFTTWARPWGDSVYATGLWPGPAEMQRDIARSYELAAEDVERAHGLDAAATLPNDRAWAALDWDSSSSGLYRWYSAGNVDPHAGSRGELLAALIMYTSAYDDRTGDILAARPAGVQALLDDLNANPEGNESPLDVADWSALSALADSLRFGPGLDEPLDFVVGRGHGPGNPNTVRGFDPTGAPAGVEFDAYAAGGWGVNVVAGWLRGDATDLVVTGPGPGPSLGPQVRGFTNLGTSLVELNYYAYGTLRSGVNVGVADTDGDGYAELVTGPGPGIVFGPHVRGWDTDGGPLGPIPNVNFYAYATLRFGANVAAGLLDADLYDELLTAPGPGAVFGPQLRGWNIDAGPVSNISVINFDAFPIPRYGANPAAGDVDVDRFDEIVAAPGPGPGAAFPARVRGFDYDGAAIAPLLGYDIVAFPTAYGARPAIGAIVRARRGDLIVGAGRDPAAGSTIVVYRYDGGRLFTLPASFIAFPGDAYGVIPSAGALAY